MAYNKVVYGGKTLMDLTGDSVTPDKLLAGETAHEPVGDIGQLVSGVCHEFRIGDAGLEQRRHHDAGEHHHHHVVAAGPRADEQH